MKKFGKINVLKKYVLCTDTFCNVTEQNMLRLELVRFVLYTHVL